MSLNVQLPARL